MKILHYSIIVILFVAGTGIVFAQSNNTQIQNGVTSTNSICTDNIIQDIKTKYASFDEERAKTEAINYESFKSEIKNDTYIFRAVSQEWTNDQVKCDVTFKTVLVLFVVTDSSGKDRDVTVLVNPESYKPQGIDVKYDVPTHGGIITEKIQSPLKQLEAGTNADQVKCNQGLQLIFKLENMSPICVKPDTSKILIERGWATPIPGISFGGPTNIINDTQSKPKVTLSDYSYDGIDKDNTTVSINNQTYYQTTLNYSDYDLKKGTSIQFQNVTFAFPQGVMTTPGGAFMMLDMKFQDGSQETYGENKINPDGSGEVGGIQIPTQYGPSSAKNSITVLSNHLNPQAGLTIYNDKIKLLVSTDNQVSQKENTTLPASFEPCDTPYPQSNTGIAVLYMPTNSVGKICVRYSNPNDPKNASLTIFDASSYQTTKNITSWAEPSIIPTGNSTVRYSVKTGNQTGFYGLTVFCSGMPFAVGYDSKSNFTLNNFPWEKSTTTSCPMLTYQFKIDSLTGIGVKYIPYP